VTEFQDTTPLGGAVTAILTGWRRPEELLRSIDVLFKCAPPPGEVIVHLDAGSSFSAFDVTTVFPTVRVISSDVAVGPGGGRNKLIQAASNELVASFDDDSFPDDTEFFSELIDVALRHPKVAIFAANILENEEQSVDGQIAEEQTFDFVGCGCVYRRSMFLKTSGYVPIPTAYGMEEVDLALRLHSEGVPLLWAPSLRVRHRVDMTKYEQPEITAASIANIGLLAFLRYPVVLWPMGLIQCLRRAVWLMAQGRRKGIIQGFLSIPDHLRRHRQNRQPLGFWQVVSYFIRRHQVV
jgi:GT2 family glycosyltransferase